MPRFPSAQGRLNHEPDPTLAVTKTCPKDGIHLYYFDPKHTNPDGKRLPVTRREALKEAAVSAREGLPPSPRQGLPTRGETETRRNGTYSSSGTNLSASLSTFAPVPLVREILSKVVDGVSSGGFLSDAIDEGECERNLVGN